MPTAIERPEFYARIDNALSHRNQMALAIEALLMEGDSNRYNPEVSALLDCLKGSPTADEFVSEGRKAAWLPLLLRGVPADGSEWNYAESLDQVAKDLTIAKVARTSQMRMFAYPLAILASSIVMFVLLSVTVIPTFQKMFWEFELTLPPQTQWVMTLSNVIQSRPVTFCVSIAVIVMLGYVAVRVVAVILQWLEASSLFGFLFSGGTNSVTAMGRFTSTLAELLNIGAPLNQAIAIAGRASQNLRFRIASDRLAEDIGSSGRFCHDSAASHHFPNLVSHALVVGPDGGPSIGLLRQIARNYVDRAQMRFHWWAGFLPPLMIAGVGLCVGFVVLSLFMPLFQLITSLSG